MTLEEITPLCEEILHLNYILKEAEHNKDYDLKKVRLKLYTKITELKIALTYLTDTYGFKAQIVSDIKAIEAESK